MIRGRLHVASTSVMLAALAALVGLSVVLPARVASAQELALVDRLVVVDATGELIGEVMAVTGRSTSDVGLPVVAFRKGFFFAVAVGRQGFHSDPGIQLKFESGNCTGQAYIRGRDRRRLFPPVAAISNVIYVAPISRAGSQRTLASELREDGSCFTGSTSTGEAVAADIVEDMNARFTPPFRLQRP